jgi:hypothetical protein
MSRRVFVCVSGGVVDEVSNRRASNRWNLDRNRLG